MKCHAFGFCALAPHKREAGGLVGLGSPSFKALVHTPQKKAAWKCLFALYLGLPRKLRATAPKSCLVFHSVYFSIIKTYNIPIWLCLTNALCNPENESS